MKTPQVMLTAVMLTTLTACTINTTPQTKTLIPLTDPTTTIEESGKYDYILKSTWDDLEPSTRAALCAADELGILPGLIADTKWPEEFDESDIARFMHKECTS